MPDSQNGVQDETGYGIYIDQFGTSAPGFERPSYVLENLKWGTPGLGTSGGTITWSMLSAGQSLASNNPLTSAATSVDPVFASTIRAAFGRWEQVGNFDFVETTNPATAGMVVVFDELSGQGPNTIGLAQYYYIGSRLTRSYISFDLNRRYRTLDGNTYIAGATGGSALNLYTLTLHEIGHSLGLGHEDDYDTIMNSISDGVLTDLTSDDIAGIRAIYGAAGSTPPTVDDYTAGADTTGIVAAGGSVTGRVDSATDEDWFRITLTQGVSYRIDLRGYDSSGGTLRDPYLRLRNSSGAILSADDDAGTGTDSRILFTAISTGTYYIAASGFEGEQGTYTLGVTDMGPVDDFAGTSATTGLVTPAATGTAVGGTIGTAGDTDWFRVTLTAGMSYRFRLTNTTLTSAHLYLRNSAGAAVGSDTDGGDNPEILYTAAASGVFYLDARAATATGTGAYTVAADNLSLDDYGATAASAGAIGVGAAVSGNIGQAADVDWLRVTLLAGTLYQIDGRASASFNGTLADPTLQLLDSNGAALRADNDSGDGTDARILYTAASSGTYYLAMRATSATATGTYRVSVTADPDDFAASVTGAGIAAVGGSATGIIERAGDRDWFRAILTAGTPYTIEVRGTSPGSGIRWTESSVILRNGAGAILAGRTESGLAPVARLTYTPTTTEAFYVDTLAYNTGVGTYTVTVSAGAPGAPAIMAESPDAAGLSASALAAITAAPTFDIAAFGLQASVPVAVRPPSPFAEGLAAPDLSDEDRHRLETAARFEHLYDPLKMTLDLFPVG